MQAGEAKLSWGEERPLANLFSPSPSARLINETAYYLTSYGYRYPARQAKCNAYSVGGGGKGEPRSARASGDMTSCEAQAYFPIGGASGRIVLQVRS